MFANSQVGGMAMAFPDVCKTPAGPSVVPVPYPNTGMGPTGTPPVPTVLFGGGPAHNLSTEIPLTQGDEAGSAGGILSSEIMGSGLCVEGASTVLVGGAPATRMTSPTVQNGTNAQGACLVPSQTVVLLLGP